MMINKRARLLGLFLVFCNCRTSEGSQSNAQELSDKFNTIQQEFTSITVQINSLMAYADNKNVKERLRMEQLNLSNLGDTCQWLRNLLSDTSIGENIKVELRGIMQSLLDLDVLCCAPCLGHHLEQYKTKLTELIEENKNNRIQTNNLQKIQAITMETADISNSLFNKLEDILQGYLKKISVENLKEITLYVAIIGKLSELAMKIIKSTETKQSVSSNQLYNRLFKLIGTAIEYVLKKITTGNLKEEKELEEYITIMKNLYDLAIPVIEKITDEKKRNEPYSTLFSVLNDRMRYVPIKITAVSFIQETEVKTYIEIMKNLYDLTMPVIEKITDEEKRDELYSDLSVTFTDLIENVSTETTAGKLEEVPRYVIIIKELSDLAMSAIVHIRDDTKKKDTYVSLFDKLASVIEEITNKITQEKLKEVKENLEEMTETNNVFQSTVLQTVKYMKDKVVQDINTDYKTLASRIINKMKTQISVKKPAGILIKKEAQECILKLCDLAESTIDKMYNPDQYIDKYVYKDSKASQSASQSASKPESVPVPVLETKVTQEPEPKVTQEPESVPPTQPPAPVLEIKVTQKPESVPPAQPPAPQPEPETETKPKQEPKQTLDKDNKTTGQQLEAKQETKVTQKPKQETKVTQKPEPKVTQKPESVPPTQTLNKDNKKTGKQLEPIPKQTPTSKLETKVNQEPVPKPKQTPTSKLETKVNQEPEQQPVQEVNQQSKTPEQIKVPRIILPQTPTTPNKKNNNSNTIAVLLSCAIIAGVIGFFFKNKKTKEENSEKDNIKTTKEESEQEEVKIDDQKMIEKESEQSL